MRYAEIQKMEREQVAYHCLMFRLAMYRERLTKITLYRAKNSKGRLFSAIVAYTTDVNGNLRSERYRLFDEEYLWFICALQQDFPDVPLIDLTDEKDKLVKSDEVAAGEEADKAVNDAEL